MGTYIPSLILLTSRLSSIWREGTFPPNGYCCNAGGPHSIDSRVAPSTNMWGQPLLSDDIVVACMDIASMHPRCFVQFCLFLRILQELCYIWTCCPQLGILNLYLITWAGKYITPEKGGCNTKSHFKLMIWKDNMGLVPATECEQWLFQEYIQTYLGDVTHHEFNGSIMN